MTSAQLAANLRAMRTLCGLTQGELAAKSGVGEKTISSYETGKRADRAIFGHLSALADACEWPLSELLGETGALLMRSGATLQFSACAECGEGSLHWNHFEGNQAGHFFSVGVPVMRDRDLSSVRELTGAMCRSLRFLANLSVTELAGLANRSVDTIRRFESGARLYRDKSRIARLAERLDSVLARYGSPRCELCKFKARPDSILCGAHAEAFGGVPLPPLDPITREKFRFAPPLSA